ncbi:helix-turn-helix domain-containing GNAT family N-acetyltransferase [Streptomyces sp. NPDC051940]|uniref:bifunctional helix-turn-helix transcriptional regulator/GNAT family N-acetyltransferase n=1 Tax=Streptomyces sp. NPDC051940 TaxID=3155675 RepID=UPI003442D97F
MPSPLANAVREVRAFNRSYTRLIGLLDFPAQMRSPYTLTEARVLYELAQSERLPVRTLRAALKLDAPQTSRILKRFKEQGLVVQERGVDDARQQEVMLTGDGRQVQAELDQRSSEAVAGMLRPLSEARLGELVGALRTVRTTLTGRPHGVGPVLREPEPGELGWIVQRHGALYAREYGWDQDFEALVAKIVADYAVSHDPATERTWIAELDGRPVGSVMCVKDDAPGTARLRLLLVEPEARGHRVGARLVDECVRFAREAGYRELTLWTNSVLTAARRIYEAAGFELVAEKPHHSYGAELVGQDWRLIL